MNVVTDESRRTFTVRRCLGRGGFGEVYLADMSSRTGLAAPVAIKVLRRDVPPESQAVQRLRDEARLLAQVRHPSLLRVYDLIVLDGRVCLVTEYVEGQDLVACLKGPGAMPHRALLQVVADVADGLHAAYHTTVQGRSGPLRIVHRDVKPSNIRVGVGGSVTLLDFGIAHTDELTREANTGTHMLVGSPKYMAPERFLRADSMLASDVYSLGVVLWEGVAGARMFQVPFPVVASLAVDEARFTAFMGERLEEIAQRVPAKILRFLAQLLAYDPSLRPSPSEAARTAERLQAEFAEQPTLRTWARTRTWPDPSGGPSDLDGLVLTEGGTLETGRTVPLFTSEAGRPPVTRRRQSVGWLVGVVALLALGTAAWTSLGSFDAAPARPSRATREPVVDVETEPVTLAPAPSGSAGPVAPPAPAPEPEPDVYEEAPSSTRREPLVRPLEATPASPTTSLAAAPPAAPAPRVQVSVRRGPFARVRLDGGVPLLLLTDDGRRHPLRADATALQSVPSGEYELHADFGVGMQQTGRRLSLPSGQQVTISCNARMQTCGIAEP